MVSTRNTCILVWALLALACTTPPAAGPPFLFDSRSQPTDTLALLGIWSNCQSGDEGFAKATSVSRGRRVMSVVGRNNGTIVGTPRDSALNPVFTLDVADLEAFEQQRSVAMERGPRWPAWATTACMALAHEVVEAVEYADGWDASKSEAELIALRASAHEKGIDAENAIREVQGVSTHRDRYCSDPVALAGGETFYVLIGPHTEAQYWDQSDLSEALPMSHRTNRNLCLELGLPTKR
jgi:hypothetical protein